MSRRYYATGKNLRYEIIRIASETDGRAKHLSPFLPSRQLPNWSTPEHADGGKVFLH
jgi:hypothetical protein